MHDSQSPDDPDLDGMNEEFDFGEHGQLDAVQTTQKRPLNKSVLIGLGFLVLGTIAGVSYRFLRHPTTPPSVPLQQPHSQPSLPVQQQQTPSAPLQPNTSELDKAFAETDKQAPVIPETHKALFVPPHPHAEPLQAAPSPSTELIGKLQDALKTLNQQIDTMLGKINYLDSYTHDMSQHLERLNQAITTMDQRLSTSNAIIDQRLSTLTNTTSTLSQDVGGVKNQLSQVRDTLKDEGLDRPAVLRAPFDQTNAQQTVDIENPEYQVHAVIPGRAWLKSTKGTIITVAEGDNLGNYGKVLVIDAAHGLVLTSSGVTFR
ncbi:MAG: hypothetical protein KBD23_02755 [Gammaproteobacteria bacterium]|nr:hypothetical protein [Gammaproteobacteria bacterium]MBP9729045.1 hypothetical protein [Gammaproteobacteria bacterium]